MDLDWELQQTGPPLGMWKVKIILNIYPFPGIGKGGYYIT